MPAVGSSQNTAEIKRKIQTAVDVSAPRTAADSERESQHCGERIFLQKKRLRKALGHVLMQDYTMSPASDTTPSTAKDERRAESNGNNE